MMNKSRSIVLFILLLSLLITGCVRRPENQPPAADEASLVEEFHIGGSWEGSLSIQDTDFDVVVVFVESEDGLAGTMNITDQGVSGMALSNISLDADKVHFEMVGGPGVAKFDGQAQEDGSIRGDFQQGVIKGSFQLARAEAAKTSDPTQTPVVSSEPLPYLAEEITIQNGDITLVGELTLPFGEGPHPAVILVSGSGPQDRNGASPSVPGYEPSRMLADHLARNGIAALRYDERGAGESNGDQNSATIMDLATDVEAALRFLRGRDEINPEQTGLLGHSEGSMLVSMVAARDPQVAFVISMGGYAVSGYDLLMKQTRKGLEVMGASEAEIDEYVQLAQHEYDLIISQDWDAVEQMTREMLTEQLKGFSEEQRDELGDPEEIIAREMNKMKTWAYSFLTYDPANDWAQINVPVLALFGELDVLVDLEQNQPPLEAALTQAGNDDVTVVVFPKANHIFQQAEVGGPQEWNQLPKEFLPGFLETVSDWLRERVDVVP